VTRAAIRVNVAGGVSDRLGSPRRTHCQPSPAREPRRRDPCAPAAARRAQAHQAPAAASPDRPRLLGRRLPRLLTWADALAIVKPATVTAWHRHGFAPFWAWKSRRVGRTPLAPEVVALIVQMARQNPLWSRRRIASELAKLGHDVGKDAVAKYMPRPAGHPPRPPSQMWGTFIRTHAVGTIAIDFFTPRPLLSNGPGAFGGPSASRSTRRLPLLLEDILRDLKRPDITLDPGALEMLRAHTWPVMSANWHHWWPLPSMASRAR
jgi:hypothetical protein